MAIQEKIDSVDKKLNKTVEKVNELECETVAMQVLHYANQQNERSTTNLTDTNKRLSCILILTTILWFLTIIGFTYYILHYDTVITTEDAITDNGGNACVGDNCNNGDLDLWQEREE